MHQESGFCAIKERRKRYKILTFHKMIYYQCHGYLTNLVPPLVSATNPYHRRRPYVRVISAHKTELYANSFIPSTTQLWNTLRQTIQANPSISLLKKVFVSECQYSSFIILALERNKLSIVDLDLLSVTYDLFRRQLLEDPVCLCRYTAETSEYFLLRCLLDNSIRNKTISKLDENERNMNTLLFGNDQLHLETNEFFKIYFIVHYVLRHTDRL